MISLFHTPTPQYVFSVIGPSLWNNLPSEIHSLLLVADCCAFSPTLKTLPFPSDV